MFQFGNLLTIESKVVVSIIFFVGGVIANPNYGHGMSINCISRENNLLSVFQINDETELVSVLDDEGNPSPYHRRFKSSFWSDQHILVEDSNIDYFTFGETSAGKVEIETLFFNRISGEAYRHYVTWKPEADLPLKGSVETFNCERRDGGKF